MITDSKSNNPFHNALEDATDTPVTFPAPQLGTPSNSNSKNANPSYTLTAPPPYMAEPSESSRQNQNSTTTNTNGNHSYAILPSPSLGSDYSSSTSDRTSFARQAPNQIYPSFDPTFLVSSGPYLTHGFPMAPPPSNIHPHPFITHDVAEPDWLKFLQEIKTAGELTQRQEVNARLPIIKCLPIVGILSTHVIRQQMKKGKSKDVTKVIDLWNHHFFHLRHIDVVLMQGRMRVSGLNGTPNSSTPFFVPDFNNGKGKSKEEDTTFRLYILSLNS